MRSAPSQGPQASQRSASAAAGRVRQGGRSTRARGERDAGARCVPWLYSDYRRAPRGGSGPAGLYCRRGRMAERGERRVARVRLPPAWAVHPDAVDETVVHDPSGRPWLVCTSDRDKQPGAPPRRPPRRRRDGGLRRGGRGRGSRTGARGPLRDPRSSTPRGAGSGASRPATGNATGRGARPWPGTASGASARGTGRSSRTSPPRTPSTPGS